MLNIKSYQLSDLNDVEDIFNSNVPYYFSANEVNDLISFLKVKENNNHFYVFRNQYKQAVAAGGFNISSEELFPPEVKPNFLEGKEFNTYALFCWGMVHREHHGKGYGKLLTQFRIDNILSIDPNVLITLRTSQITAPFYEKQGFKVGYIEKEYWGKTFDLVQMYFSKLLNHPL